MPPLVDIAVGVLIAALASLLVVAVDTWRAARKALRLLEGDAAIDRPGLVARVRAIETRLAQIQADLDAHPVDEVERPDDADHHPIDTPEHDADRADDSESESED